MASSNSSPTSLGLFSSSDYKISSLAIVTSAGQSVDIRNIMLELNIYEDVFSPVITGDVTIGDGADIISTYMLHGNEFLLVDVDKPTLNKPIQKIFRIYKISDRKFGTASLQNYTLYFCSEELLLSTQLLVSKSYKGLRIDQMVNDLLVNKLQVNPNKISNGIFSQTQTNFDIIIPRMQPLEAIQWLTPRAYNNNQNLWFFFENKDGFNFTSYENLISKQTYNSYSRSAKLTDNVTDNFNSFNFITVVEDFDIVKAMRMGSYNSTLFVLDLVNRSFSSTNFNITQLQKSAMLNGNLPVNQLQDRLGYSLTSADQSMLKFVASSDSDPTFNPALYKNWLPQTIVRLGHIHSFKIIVSIPGDMLMKAGSVINVIIPKMQTQTSATNNDPMRTGNYFVSGVHHKFTADIMTSILELLSDSVATALPSAQQNLPAVTTILDY
jgi:hypothetical protein